VHINNLSSYIEVFYEKSSLLDIKGTLKLQKNIEVVK